MIDWNIVGDVFIGLFLYSIFLGVLKGIGDSIWKHWKKPSYSSENSR